MSGMGTLKDRVRFPALLVREGTSACNFLICLMTCPRNQGKTKSTFNWFLTGLTGLKLTHIYGWCGGHMVSPLDSGSSSPG